MLASRSGFLGKALLSPLQWGCVLPTFSQCLDTNVPLQKSHPFKFVFLFQFPFHYENFPSSSCIQTETPSYLVILIITESLHWDGFQGSLPTIFQGEHLLAAFLQRLHHIIILVQGLLLVLAKQQVKDVGARREDQRAKTKSGKNGSLPSDNHEWISCSHKLYPFFWVKKSAMSQSLPADSYWTTCLQFPQQRFNLVSVFEIRAVFVIQICVYFPEEVLCILSIFLELWVKIRNN